MHPARDGFLMTHLKVMPTNPNEAAASSQASPQVHPCPPVSERDSATVVPAHTRAALARLGIKIACDLAASPPLPHVLAPYPALFSTHMTRRMLRIAL